MTRFPEQDLFLRADAELYGVVDRLTPEQLALAAPQGWTRRFTDPTLEQIVLVHAHDEAFVPDVIAGRSLDEIGDRWESVLLDPDALVAYRTAQQAAQDAASAELDPRAPVHFSYGDYPLREALTHLAMYRGFQSWQIAHVAGIRHGMSPELIEGLNAYVMPHADDWRQWGVFPPAQEPPADADDEVRLLCASGNWMP
jgi:hypothetical protein